MFEESFKGISKVCFDKVLRVFQESFRCVSKKIEVCFMGFLKVFQGYLKEVLRVFKNFCLCFKED